MFMCFFFFFVTYKIAQVSNVYIDNNHPWYFLWPIILTIFFIRQSDNIRCSPKYHCSSKTVQDTKYIEETITDIADISEKNNNKKTPKKTIFPDKTIKRHK